MYTGIKNKIYPIALQLLITCIWICGSCIIAIFPVFTRIKRNLFPCTEFRVEQNELIEEQNATKRNFIVGTVVIGTILHLNSIIMNILHKDVFCRYLYR